jgi:hypothetical protein
MKITKTAIAILLLIALFWGWYSVAANYSYGAVSGTYRFRLNGEESTLVLNVNRSFHQELKHDGSVEHAQGTWRRLGEGGVVFSKEFLKVSGQETRPDGQADGEVKKRLGLFLSIAFNPDPGGPVFHKELFR